MLCATIERNAALFTERALSRRCGRGCGVVWRGYGVAWVWRAQDGHPWAEQARLGDWWCWERSMCWRWACSRVAWPERVPRAQAC